MLAILKGKPILGLIGLFIPLTSLAGAIRLASPTSPWARRRYPADGHKLARAQARFARIARRRRVAGRDRRRSERARGAEEDSGGAPPAHEPDA